MCQRPKRERKKSLISRMSFRVTFIHRNARSFPLYRPHDDDTVMFERPSGTHLAVIFLVTSVSTRTKPTKKADTAETSRSPPT